MRKYEGKKKEERKLESDGFDIRFAID